MLSYIIPTTAKVLSSKTYAPPPELDVHIEHSNASLSVSKSPKIIA